MSANSKEMTKSQGRSVSGKIRVPRLEPIGISGESILTNILLMTFTPGVESRVKKHVENRIRTIALEDVAVREARKKRVSTSSVAREQHRRETTPLLKPMFFSMLERFQMAVMYNSYGYGIATNVANVDYVKACQTIQGRIAVPDYEKADKDFRFLQQCNSSAFWQVDEHSLPLLTVCQVQEASVIRTISGTPSILPLLYAIEERIVQFAESKGITTDDLKVVVVSSSEWSDCTLLIRSNDIQVSRGVVDAVISLRTGDIARKWKTLTTHSVIPENLRKVLDNQYKALKRRYGRLICCAHPEPALAPVLEMGDNHIFSEAVSCSGLPVPLAEEASKEGSKTGNLASWKIGGEVDCSMLLSTKLVRYSVLIKEVRAVAQELKLPWNRMEKCFQSRENGLNDISIPGWMLTPGRQRYRVDLKEVLFAFYRIKASLSEPRFQPSSLLKAAHLRINAKGEFKENSVMHSKTKAKNFFSSTTFFHEFVRKGFGTTGDPGVKPEDGNPRLDMLMKLKENGVSRHLRDKYLRTLHILQEQLADPCEAGLAFELLDAYFAWHIACSSAMDSESAIQSGDMELMVRAFTEPFGEILDARAFSGIYKSEFTSSVRECAGGSHMLLTAIGGLQKGVLALIGPPCFTGGILNITQRPAAANWVHSFKFDSELEVLYSISKVNPVQASHAANIGVVFHEFLHPIECSSAFRSTMASSGRAGKQLAELLSKPQDVHQGMISSHFMSEMVVEYLFAWLVCFTKKRKPEQNSGLYSQIAMLLFALDRGAVENTCLLNQANLGTNAIRCYFVEKMLLSQETGDPALIGKEHLLRAFDGWWEENCRFLFAGRKNEQELRKLKESLSTVLNKILDLPVFVSWMEVIANTVNSYFDCSAEAVLPAKQKYSELERSKALRHDFIEVLRKAQYDGNDNIFKEETYGSKSKLSPVHIVFSEENGGEERTLRVRRLESLIANILLIRSLYTSLLDSVLEVTQHKDCGLMLNRTPESGIDFSNAGERKVFLDPVNGTLFTVGDEEHQKHISIRQEILLSMWQVAEVCKLSEIICLKELSDTVSGKGHFLFFPDKSTIEFLREQFVNE